MTEINSPLVLQHTTGMTHLSIKTNTEWKADNTNASVWI